MKRDLDLIRKILLWMEEQEHGFAQTKVALQGYTAEQIAFHVYLLGDGGLAKVSDTTAIGNTSPTAIPLNLTWAGYEFIDAAKDETLWGKAKSVLIKPTGGVAFSVLLEWLKAEAKSRLGIP